MSNIKNLLGGAFVADVGVQKFEVNLVGVDTPKMTFDQSFDQDELDKLSKYAPKFKPLTGRFNPFDTEKLRASVGDWSALINKPVITFQDACEHAAKLCRMWVEEDKELAMVQEAREKAQLEKEVNKAVAIMTEGTKEYAIEQARVEWREAVTEAKRVTAEQNAKVKEKRDYYRNLRDS